VLGLCYAVGVQRIAQLLEQRIVDALLIGLPDQPQPPTSARLTVVRADTGVGRLCRFCKLPWIDRLFSESFALHWVGNAKLTLDTW